ncbi:hypothetical protein [Acidipila rosea]|uniref:Type IV pilus assembly protein PilM n=1 Tax=Acidipila rosea TaxID=768535 RepID=A0A4R1LE27_9BACT|nr:hypothetical protein [Acidipila rosea]MBW4026044.1 hypothetical protein [Acidobacteriota bacterium]MBW4044037.1 hypothetical protein [Acidobacteriota bacterium]TCK75997.1 type IV pilus assembly protein PilM [Acidipila rosea]
MPATIRIFTPNTHKRPQLACDITPHGVLAARQSGEQEAETSFAELPAGLMMPGVKTPNFLDLESVAATVRKAVEAVAGRERQLTVVVPDATSRVLILDFETLPAKRKEALPIVRFRLRRLVPFDTDDAAVSYQVLSQSGGTVRVLATVMPGAVRAEYEAVVRKAGFEPGVILPSTLACLAALNTAEPALVINRNGNFITTAITRSDELLLYRTLELSTVAGNEDTDLQEAVAIALAYFEDNLATVPRYIYYAGRGGAEVLQRALGDNTVQVKDLIEATSPATKGLMAPVAGALTS